MTAARSVADSLELRDRAAVELDGFVRRAASVLDETEVDQAAADLLRVADALGKLETATECRCGLVEPAGARVDVPDDAERGRQAAQVRFPLEHLDGGEAVSERIVELPLDRFGARELKEQSGSCGR